MNKEGEESFLSIYPTRNVLIKTTNFNRFHCNKFIAICRSLYKGCYCMVRDSDYRVFRLIFYKSSSCPCFNFWVIDISFATKMHENIENYTSTKLKINIKPTLMQWSINIFENLIQVKKCAAVRDVH